MAKRKVRVINRGKRIRDRLGSRFLPNETKEMEVNRRQYLTLKAVKDFEVTIIDKNVDNDNDINVNNNMDNNNKNNNDADKADNAHNNGELGRKINYDDLTIDEVIKAVKEGKIDVDEAIALEVTGKNRVTLLNKLEDLKKEG